MFGCRGRGDEGDGDDLPERAEVSRGAATGAGGGVSAGEERWVDWVVAGDAGRVDSGEGSAGDAEGDVPRLVGEEGQGWQLIWLQIRPARRCCGGFARRRAGLPVLRRRGLDGALLSEGIGGEGKRCVRRRRR